MTIKRFLITTGILVILAFIGGYCSAPKDVETKEVYLPGIKAKSETIYKPSPIVYKDKFKYIYQKDTISGLGKFDTVIVDRFAKIESNTQKVSEYIKAVTKNTYDIPIVYDSFKTTNHIETQGELLSFQQDIEEFPKKVLVNSSKEKINIFAGAEIGTTKELTTPVIKGNIFLQNKKGNAYSISYDSDKRIWAGILFKF